MAARRKSSGLKQDQRNKLQPGNRHDRYIKPTRAQFNQTTVASIGANMKLFLFFSRPSKYCNIRHRAY